MTISGKVTHTDYQHPKHLRIVTDEWRNGWSIGAGWYRTKALCVSLLCSDYAKLNKPNLPSWDDADQAACNVGVVELIA